jgi:hypothetical protein
MRLPLSVKFFTFTTRNSLQEFGEKVKGNLQRNSEKNEAFSERFLCFSGQTGLAPEEGNDYTETKCETGGKKPCLRISF